MTRIPGADWRPVRNFTPGGVTRPPRGMVLHTAVGSYEGTISWQNNPASQVSSYAVIAKDGRMAQCVDLDNRAWTQGSGNPFWIGVEMEGSSEPLTDAQLQTTARLYAFLVQTYGIPLQKTDDPAGMGLGWHGMGGGAWGGHYNCPGPAMVAQRDEILRRAAVILNRPAPGPAPAPATPWAALYKAAHDLGQRFAVGPLLRRGDNGQAVRDLQFALVAGAAQHLIVDGSFGAATEGAVRNVQAFFHIHVDGIVGPQTRGVIAAVLKVKFP